MKKGALHIDLTVLMILAVIVLATIVVLVIIGVQQPGQDIGKTALARSCCQINMPLVCESGGPRNAKCVIPENMKSAFPCEDCTLEFVANKIGISGEENIKRFCGCS